VIAPWARTSKNVALGYGVGKISAGCLVRQMLTTAATVITVHGRSYQEVTFMFINTVAATAAASSSSSSSSSSSY